MQKQPKKQSALNFDGKEIIQENSILYLFSLKNTLQHKLQLLLFITYKMIQYFWCQSLFLLTHTHTLLILLFTEYTANLQTDLVIPSSIQ